jgi:aryl-alcohol dehydrogenase-like predicted oxidoreductase
VSNFDRHQTREMHEVLLARGHSLTSNQIEFSLLERGPERSGLLRTCQDLGVTVIAYSPLGMGLLTGKFSPSHPPPSKRRRAFARVNLERLLGLMAALREVGQSYGGRTPGQVALNWVIAKGALPIPGAKNADQARENAGALGWRMSPDEMRHLEMSADWALGL